MVDGGYRVRGSCGTEKGLCLKCLALRGGSIEGEEKKEDDVDLFGVEFSCKIII